MSAHRFEHNGLGFLLRLSLLIGNGKYHLSGNTL